MATQMTAHEIETLLISEGLAAYNMERRDMREGESARKGEDGEYDIADYLDAGTNPEVQVIFDQLQGLGMEFLADEFGAVEVEDDEPEDDEDTPEAGGLFGWLLNK